MAKAGIPTAIRQKVAERAIWCCEYCKSQEQFAPQPFTLDHIMPISKGGDNDFKNLALACQGCNGSKLAKLAVLDPLTKTVVYLFNPRLQIWTEHFAWDETFTRIVGLTSNGRATVNALKLNRKQLFNLRTFLIVFGEHPPKASY